MQRQRLTSLILRQARGCQLHSALKTKRDNRNSLENGIGMWTNHNMQHQRLTPKGPFNSRDVWYRSVISHRGACNSTYCQRWRAVPHPPKHNWSWSHSDDKSHVDEPSRFHERTTEETLTTRAMKTSNDVCDEHSTYTVETWGIAKENVLLPTNHTWRDSDDKSHEDGNCVNHSIET